jgi:hypothetical protein
MSSDELGLSELKDATDSKRLTKTVQMWWPTELLYLDRSRAR